MPWVPPEPGAVPTLGYLVIDWMTEFLAAPETPEFEPFVPHMEQEDFILRFYELNPLTGKRIKRRGVLSRSRGWGKSPLLGALALAEALAPVLFEGWDANGQPVGKPWSTIRTPLVQVLAVSEKQTGNTWRPLLEMAAGGSLCDEYPGVEPLNTAVLLPGKGRIEPITSSAESVKGAPSHFAVMDQTEEWVKSNGGHNLFEKVKNNTAKRGGSFVESPNAFTPGKDSVAERSAMFYELIREGRAFDASLLYDHREAPPETSIDEVESLTAGLRYAYGDASAHPDGCVLHDPPCAPGYVDLDPLISTIMDPTSEVQVSRSDFLNQVTHASDSWLTQPEWAARTDAHAIIADREAITLGFDGSRKRTRSVTDATALIGCRVSDGHVFEIKVWEEPTGARRKDWQIPTAEVDKVVRETFARYNVVGMYADPALWEGFVADWEASFSKRLKVKSTRDHPIEFWMVGGRRVVIARALEKFHSAVVDGEMSHDGSSTLTRHMLNARRRESTGGYSIAKEFPESERKIDAAVAAVLAYQCRIDAVAAGVNARRTSTTVRRLY